MALEESPVLYPGGQAPSPDGNGSTRQIAPAAGGFLGASASGQLLPFPGDARSDDRVGALAKKAAEQIEGQQVELVISQQSDPAEMGAYEELLFDAMLGNSARFARQDYVEQAWRMLDPILDGAVPVYEYKPGTWGSAETSPMIAPDGGWFDPTPV